MYCTRVNFTFTSLNDRYPENAKKNKYQNTGRIVRNWSSNVLKKCNLKKNTRLTNFYFAKLNFRNAFEIVIIKWLLSEIKCSFIF